MERKHAIIVIKNNEGKYLNYYDEIWNSYLFINCKLTDELDFNFIKNEIFNKYDIKIDNINLVMDKVHTKFSVKDKIDKEYHHFFYNVDVLSLPNDKKFKYFTYDELLNDKRIQEVNADIVSFIKEMENV